ncbi:MULTISPECIES: asparagine synthase-related protein [unclassified Leucobacter]|uniref:asparagine synthase-related protein n=1 Tax=unclassified Leucobacter TaxID=2621730 RepID=UPI00165DD4CA|nr:hypothetical protein [Leucobacter sp. cx-87]
MLDRFLELSDAQWASYPTPNATVRVWGIPDDELGLVAAAEALDTEKLARMGGHWAAIVERPDSITLIQDPIRSRPLFIARLTAGRSALSRRTITVSDSIAAARGAVGGGTLDPEAQLEFSQLGYVAGARTLFTEITQVQAGEWVSVDQNGEQTQEFYRRLHYTGRNLSTDADLDARFTDGLDIAFSRMLNWVGDRQIVIPLSGGLDSRLLAIALHDLGHHNVVNFTYGVGETSEVAISRKVSAALGQRWEFIQYSVEELREAWRSDEAKAFVGDSYAGASLPHVQDWYAVRELRRRGLVADDAVFLAGHTVVGNMHDEHIVDLPQEVSRSQLFDLMVHHHARISANPVLSRSERFRDEFERFLDRLDYDNSARARLEALENWNILERQTKYINNSMRGYEHFGYAWALPMLDAAVFEAWEDFATAPAKDRDWYQRYVSRRYQRATGETIGTFAPTQMKPARRELIKSSLRRVGLLTLAERAARSRAVAHHPMGFQAFSGEASERDIRREIMRGGTPMGIWAHQFLADTWTPGSDLFSTPPTAHSRAGVTSAPLPATPPRESQPD